MNAQTDRLPPQNAEAEQSVLGSILLDREAIATALEILAAEDFYQDVHQIVFKAVLKLYEQNRDVDAVTLAERLRQDGMLDRIGGATYLSTLARSVPTSANVRHYAQIVRDKAMLRRLIQAGTTIVGSAFDASEEPKTLLDKAETLIFTIARDNLAHPYIPLNDLLKTAYERLERLYDSKVRVTGVPTGFPELDDITSGFQGSDLIIIAARPSRGKTTLATNIARNVAVRHGLPVGMFSLEMSADQLAMRFLASEVPYDAHKMRTGNLQERDFPLFAEALGRLGDAPIFIDDTPSLSVLELRGRARRMKRDHNVSLLILDYLQLMHITGRVENRQQEISTISRELKFLARELKIPVVALSQLSRGIEKRDDRRPQLSDLRESGAIEQDADIVSFIHFPEDNVPFRDWKGFTYRTVREQGVLETSRGGKSRQYPLTPGMDIAEIIIGKQRNGPVGSICLAFMRETGRFFPVDVSQAPLPAASGGT